MPNNAPLAYSSAKAKQKSAVLSIAVTPNPALHLTGQKLRFHPAGEIER